tara:strand:+ start:4555 stop:4803 length:249 start_codon:yes stop_codon:yes gene_type:complete
MIEFRKCQYDSPNTLVYVNGSFVGDVQNWGKFLKVSVYGHDVTFLREFKNNIKPFINTSVRIHELEIYSKVANEKRGFKTIG